uniref:Uncharacterized protein n=1 Tax=Romanomermis culicivorax TaxID=13658 RepID=A0A915HSD2_ROMCU
MVAEDWYSPRDPPIMPFGHQLLWRGADIVREQQRGDLNRPTWLDLSSCLPPSPGTSPVMLEKNQFWEIFCGSFDILSKDPQLEEDPPANNLMDFLTTRNDQPPWTCHLIVQML